MKDKQAKLANQQEQMQSTVEIQLNEVKCKKLRIEIKNL
jgi:hypothetical protein